MQNNWPCRTSVPSLYITASSSQLPLLKTLNLFETEQMSPDNGGHSPGSLFLWASLANWKRARNTTPSHLYSLGLIYNEGKFEGICNLVIIQDSCVCVRQRLHAEDGCIGLKSANINRYKHDRCILFSGLQLANSSCRDRMNINVFMCSHTRFISVFICSHYRFNCVFVCSHTRFNSVFIFSHDRFNSVFMCSHDSFNSVINSTSLCYPQLYKFLIQFYYIILCRYKIKSIKVDFCISLRSRY